MLELGLVDYKLPNNCVVEHMTWADDEAYQKTLTSKYRYSLRKEILKHSDRFEVSYEKPTDFPHV